MLDLVIPYIEKIPATFWGVVIGSGFTILGIHLTNRANDRRLERQLAHDRDLKNRERELNLRKDVYLAASEAIATGFATLARYVDLSIPNERLTERFIEKAPAMAKVHVIASEATAKALSELQTELSAAMLRLSAKRIPIAAEQERARSIKEQMDRFSGERDEMLRLMKQHNLEGIANEQRWAAIRRFYELAQSQTVQLADANAKAQSALAEMRLELAATCGAELPRVGKLLVPLIVAVRKELDLPIDPEAYASILGDAQDKQRSALEAFLNDLRRKDG
jgi:hypothetical protein